MCVFSEVYGSCGDDALHDDALAEVAGDEIGSVTDVNFLEIDGLCGRWRYCAVLRGRNKRARSNRHCGN